jgi:hypothetical protein
MSFSMSNSNTPVYNDLEYKISALDVRYGPTKSLSVKDVLLMGGTLTEPTYNPTPLDFYEVYQSLNNIQMYCGGLITSIYSVAIVRCGGLITICLPELYQNAVGGTQITSSTGAIPTRFLPGVILNGVSTSCTFPLLTIDSGFVKKNGKITINTNGSFTIYPEVTDSSVFSAGFIGFGQTYLSWNR